MDGDNIIDLATIKAHILQNFPDIDTPKPLGEPTMVMPIPYVWATPTSLPPREFLFGKHYIRKFVSATVAPGGLGKSSLVLTEVLSMVSGKRLLNITPRKRYKVWYWNGEDPYDELQRRIQAIALNYGLREEDLMDYLWVDSGRDSPMRVAEETASGAVIVRPVFDCMEQYIKEFGIDLVVIDPFVSAHAVNENDNSIINEVAKGFARLSDRCNCSIEAVHHVRKARDGVETQAEDARGASALVDACRSVRTLSRMDKAQSELYGFDDTARKSFFYMSLGKANLGPPADPRWYQHISVDLGNGNDEYPADSVGVVATWEPPALFDGISNADVARVQAQILGFDCRADPRAPNYIVTVVGSILGISTTEDGGKKRVKKMVDAWLKSGLLEETTELDEHRKMRKFIRVGKAINEAAA